MSWLPHFFFRLVSHQKLGSFEMRVFFIDSDLVMLGELLSLIEDY